MVLRLVIAILNVVGGLALLVVLWQMPTVHNVLADGLQALEERGRDNAGEVAMLMLLVGAAMAQLMLAVRLALGNSRWAMWAGVVLLLVDVAVAGFLVVLTVASGGHRGAY
jgi:hypothetical protein